MTDLRIVPPASEKTSQESLVAMLEETLQLAKDGKINYAVVVCGTPDDGVGIKWQGPDSIAFTRGAVTGLETAKLVILQRNVKIG